MTHLLDIIWQYLDPPASGELADAIVAAVESGLIPPIVPGGTDVSSVEVLQLRGCELIRCTKEIADLRAEVEQLEDDRDSATRTAQGWARRAKELELAVIEARNPGIDMDAVRAQRPITDADGLRIDGHAQRCDGWHHPISGHCGDCGCLTCSGER